MQESPPCKRLPSATDYIEARGETPSQEQGGDRLLSAPFLNCTHTHTPLYRDRCHVVFPSETTEDQRQKPTLAQLRQLAQNSVFHPYLCAVLMQFYQRQTQKSHHKGPPCPVLPSYPPPPLAPCNHQCAPTISLQENYIIESTMF